MSSRIPAQLRESLALLLLILVNLHLQLHCLTSAPLSPFRGSILSRVMLDENILISVRKPRDSAGILGAGSSCPSRSSFPVNVSTDSELQEFVKFWLTRKSNCIPKPLLFTAANHSAVLRGAQNQNPKVTWPPTMLNLIDLGQIPLFSDCSEENGSEIHPTGFPNTAGEAPH